VFSFSGWFSTAKFLHISEDAFLLIILLAQSIRKGINLQIFSFIRMDEKFDREKVVDCMFDPITSSILAELEEDKKECSFLAQQVSISESEVLQRLSYLIEHEFIYKNSDDGKCLLAANSDKLSTIVESSDNFDETINSLEKMDSFLN
jgi:hypothetical protein